jgi:hypothetical protein
MVKTHAKRNAAQQAGTSGSPLKNHTTASDSLQRIDHERMLTVIEDQF